MDRERGSSPTGTETSDLAKNVLSRAVGQKRQRKLRAPGGRTLVVTPVFDTYWRFACARQETFMRRVAGALPPWSDDPVLTQHRFTNAYRASEVAARTRHSSVRGPLHPRAGQQ